MARSSSSVVAVTGVSRPTACRRGASLADVCVALGVGAVLLVAILARAARLGGDAERAQCATNLRAIAAGSLQYVEQDMRRASRNFARTYYDPSAPLDRTLKGNTLPGSPPAGGAPTGRAPTDAPSFDAANPKGPVGANNVMASFYVVLRQTDLGNRPFVCPGGEATPAYTPRDPVAFANWPAPYAAYCGYSYSCPFPSAKAAAAGWTLDPSSGPEMPLAADLNPGGTGPTAVGYGDGPVAVRAANSPNHGFDGQNVAYCDQHVEWQTTPFAGRSRPQAARRDNIYASAVGASLAGDGAGGAVWDKPADPFDAVLLPTAADSPGTAVAGRSPSTVSAGFLLAAVSGLGPVGWAAVAACLLAVVGGVVWAVRRRKASRPPPPPLPTPS